MLAYTKHKVINSFVTGYKNAAYDDTVTHSRCNPTRQRDIVIQVITTERRTHFIVCVSVFCVFRGVSSAQSLLKSIQLKLKQPRDVHDAFTGHFYDCFIRATRSIINVTDGKTALGNSAVGRLK